MYILFKNKLIKVTLIRHLCV